MCDRSFLFGAQKISLPLTCSPVVTLTNQAVHPKGKRKSHPVVAFTPFPTPCIQRLFIPKAYAPRLGIEKSSVDFENVIKPHRSSFLSTRLSKCFVYEYMKRLSLRHRDEKVCSLAGQKNIQSRGIDRTLKSTSTE